MNVLGRVLFFISGPLFILVFGPLGWEMLVGVTAVQVMAYIGGNLVGWHNATVEGNTDGAVR